MIKFGPAGLGGVKTAEKVLEEYNKTGFKACEIAFTYSAYIKNLDDAKRIGKKAKELGIDLSIHAPYFINLNSDEKDKIEASKKRILKCCKIGEALGVKIVVFHPGYYGNNYAKVDESRKREIEKMTYKNIKENILDLMKEIKKKGWKVKIAPETMGKVNVFGSIDEVSQLVKDTGCSFCIDFAHILARDKKVDYEKVERLFPQKNWHVHFSGIIYGELGERKHRTTEASEWKTLLGKLPRDKNIIIVCESPTLIEDSMEAMKIWERMKK